MLVAVSYRNSSNINVHKAFFDFVADLFDTTFLVPSHA